MSQNPFLSKHLNPYTLHFKQPYHHFESSYRLDHQIENIKYQRLLILLSVFFYNVFIVVDYFQLPSEAPIYIGIRLLGYTPMALLIFRLTFSKTYVYLGNALITLLSFIGYLGLLYIHMTSSSLNFFSYRYALLFTFIFYLFLLSVAYTYALVVGSLMFFIYNLAEWVLNAIPSDIHNDSNILFAYIIFLGILFTYRNEKNARTQYLLTKQLMEEKNNVKWMNTHLENRVRRRTKELKEAFERLSTTENAFHLLIAQSADPMLLVDASNQIIDCNEPFVKIFELKNRDAILSTPIEDYVPASSAFLEASRKKNSPSQQISLPLYLFNDKQIEVEIHLTHLQLPTQKVTHMVIRDISERKALFEKLESLSYTDQLTGLYNRRYFSENTASLLLPDNFPLTIILADVNGLKLVNDTFGHMVGDNYLNEAASLLKQVFSSSEKIYRLGGDEFAVISVRCTKEQIKSQIETFLLQAKNIRVAGVPLSLSFGYSVIKDTHTHFEEGFKLAEDQMYRHKVLESQNVRRKTIDMMLETLHIRSPEEERHAQRTTRYALRLGKAIGLTENKLKELELVGLLHDLGKIAIPEDVLNKKEPLTMEEIHLLKQHPEIGYRILNTSEELRTLSEYVLHHHEHWDGSGYPSGYKEEQIPLLSRIIFLADAYDAMTSSRPYRITPSRIEVLSELNENAGKHFDPELVRKFLELIDKD